LTLSRFREILRTIAKAKQEERKEKRILAAFTSFDTALLVLKGLNGEKISLQDYLTELGLMPKAELPSKAQAVKTAEAILKKAREQGK
jgi:hypothetical protein